jgi:Asp-tRNA(Asn)/Glu-tRNA(Gln) amidotransferase A subunit family amidase
MGKTVTAELAVYTPGKTANPHDPSRTPGGSSSGSAAAVAAGMVPLAIGTQTNGSVIRPASYCGVVGFKPTLGMIPRDGILQQAPSLDQVGVFATSIMDAALLSAILMEPNDSGLSRQSFQPVDPGLVKEHAPHRPRLGFCKTPVWMEATELTRKACLDFIDGIGEDVAEIELPETCNMALDCHRTIMLYEMSLNYRRYFVDHHDQLSSILLGMLAEGQQISISAYLDAKGQAAEMSVTVDSILNDFDAVLTPATPSEAPSGLESTGSPVFCTIWSLCGVPALSLPALGGADDLPLGIQLVGAMGADNRLLGAADWLWNATLTTTG